MRVFKKYKPQRIKLLEACISKSLFDLGVGKGFSNRKQKQQNIK